MTRRSLVLALCGALGCFALGLAAARLAGTAAPPPVEPRMVSDPATLELLPGASLHLELPRGFDAGAP